jgi:uncharacterized protein YjbJ (UPF0337 family)
MNSSVLEGQWRQLRGKIKEHWGDLTDDDLDRADGKFDQMVGILQERYGYSNAEAEQKLSSFLDEFDDPLEPA